MPIDSTRRYVSRTTATAAAYRRRVDEQLRWMAERETCSADSLSDVIAWFSAQHWRWARSTVRQYRASLRLALDETELHPEVRARLTRQLQHGPVPRDTGPRRTSARKRKSVSATEMKTLVETLARSSSPDGPLLANYLVFGVALFLRPAEFLKASIEGTTLKVINAKATNGRGNGTARERDISPMGRLRIDKLAVFIETLREAAARAGSWKKLNNRLASRLARTCQTLGIPRVSLYTVRHLGMATAKTWMAPEEVAAAAGHGHVRTAMTHYAKARTGWWGIKLAGLPSAASVASVRGIVRTYHQRAELPGPKPA